METRRYHDPEKNRWTKEELIKRTVNEDGSIDEEWRSVNVADWVYALAFIISLPLFFFSWMPLICICLLWVGAQNGEYISYVHKGPPDKKMTS